MRTYSIAVFGCTGNAGRATALFAIKFAAQSGERVALSGRNRDKVEATRKSICEEVGCNADDVGIIVADAKDASSLVALAKSTRVLITCAGPYGRYGEPVVRACIDAKTHYVDITGEAKYVNAMENKYGEEAATAGVTLLSFAGYDCMPAELAFFEAAAALDNDISSLELVFSTRGGGFPRGTVHTILDGIEGKTPKAPRSGQGKKFVPSSRKRDFKNALSPLRWLLPAWSSRMQQFTVQNFMSAINVPVILRAADAMGVSNFDLRYRLSIAGRLSSSFLTLWGLIPFLFYQIAGILFAFMAVFPLTRWLIRYCLQFYSFDGNARGKVRVDARGTSKGGKTADINIRMNGDPGIYATGRLCAAVALALLDASKDNEHLASGFTSPVVALRPTGKLMPRLAAAGITVDVSL